MYLLLEKLFTLFLPTLAGTTKCHDKNENEIFKERLYGPSVQVHSGKRLTGPSVQVHSGKFLLRFSL